MKRSIVMLALLAIIATGATAADYPSAPPTKPRPVPQQYQAAPAPAPSWSGLYIAAIGGGGFTVVDGQDLVGPTAGGAIGYNYRLSNNVVLGIEGDGSWADIRQTVGAVTFRVDALSTLRARVGYALGPWLIYGTGGGAAGHGKLTVAGLGSAGNWHWGFAGGGGLEYALGSGWVLRSEYLYSNLSAKDYSPAGVPLGSSGDIGVHQVRGGIAFRF